MDGFVFAAIFRTQMRQFSGLFTRSHAEAVAK